jgi:REP element-mobilizing transposase RayT
MTDDRTPRGAVGATFRLPEDAAPPHQLPVRKRIRLDRETYDGQRAYSITVNKQDRHRAFVNATVARDALHALRDAQTRHDMRVLAYCLMPDHAHFLLLGGPGTNPIDFMKRFKQLSGFGYKQATGRKLWQKGYYDHIVRFEEGLEDVALYIFGNPVRAGLVDSFASYEFSGGEYFEQMLDGQPEGSPYTMEHAS